MTHFPHLIVVTLLTCALSACNLGSSQLETVLARGELVVATRNAATTYYQGPEGATGFEYDMVRMFANELGVDLRLTVSDSFSELLPTVARGEADFAAAGLAVTEQRQKLVRFGPSYQQITPQLVYRIGTTQPEDFNTLNGRLEVIAGSSHVERLMALREEYPGLQWVENSQLESEELLYLVSDKAIDYTVADSNEVAINQRFYPELRVAFGLSAPEPLAWAFPRGRDDSLYRAAEHFIERIRADGTLAQLRERYYGHVKDFDYVGTRRFLAHIEARLPRYRALFKQGAVENGLDWKLLAAVGYQESHWDPAAESPTGVRGIMMLTKQTMRHIGVEDREDPRQSILGGARYLAMLKEKIPEQVTEPDRTWLALAAYNIGLGHLEDARVLTEKNGDDPNRWVDLKRYLPLLSQKHWYSQTRFGYARGREPVDYVESIRSYYDILLWITDWDKRAQVQSTAQPVVGDPT